MFVFIADLTRRIDVPHVVDFVAASSYGKSTVSSANVKIKKDLNIFIDWVVDNAPKITVDEIMECRTPEEMIAFVWKKGGGLQQYKEKLWRLRSE